MLYSSVCNAHLSLDAAWRWPHFSVVELACRCGGRFCGGEYWHNAEFLDALEALRAEIGRPLIINSAHRCAQWNAAVGGAPRSQHKQLAVDVALRGHDRHVLLAAANRLGFGGTGLARTFLHLDRRARPARWIYKGAHELWQTF